MNKYKTIDLFAGAGGLSFGFQQTGKFLICAAAEINKNASKTYNHNISQGSKNFHLIEDVVGFDFSALNSQFDEIDVVIGGPPCQGFSNANRQKNHFISLNNGLVKEFFRAIREIRPKAFVMENVNMLRSDIHRFYESVNDKNEIDLLNASGTLLPKREEKIIIASSLLKGISLGRLQEIGKYLVIPEDLFQSLNVLYKNLNNPNRLNKFLFKHGNRIEKAIMDYLSSVTEPTEEREMIIEKLQIIMESFLNEPSKCETALNFILTFQKTLLTMEEINQNKLLGRFYEDGTGAIFYKVNSYSVIDYINAILGNDYVQNGSTICADWFGVPQNRRRYIVMGVRKDIFTGDTLELPKFINGYKQITVGEAIMDISEYPVGYSVDYPELPYRDDLRLSEYAKKMRFGSTGISNHITTKTTEVAMARFKAIQPGKNFHSLSSELKSTYSKPERTQNTIYLRLDESKPSGTVVNVRKSMWIHPHLNRAITVREAARLQSFPDCFTFVGSKDSQYQQVGNAVPPLLAEAIANKLLEYLE